MTATLRATYEANRQRFEQAQEIVAVHLRHLLLAKGLVDPVEVATRVHGRAKGPDSVMRKVRVKAKRDGFTIRSFRSLLAHVDDLAGVRIVCDYLTDVAFILGHLRRHQAFEVLPKKMEDYIQNPRNGYRGFHLVVRVQTTFGRTKCEIQIQTALQHAWAAKSHTLLYKMRKRDLKGIPTEIRRLVESQSDLLYDIDQMAGQVSRAVRQRLRRIR